MIADLSDNINIYNISKDNPRYARKNNRAKHLILTNRMQCVVIEGQQSTSLSKDPEDLYDTNIVAIKIVIAVDCLMVFGPWFLLFFLERLLQLSYLQDL